MAALEKEEVSLYEICCNVGSLLLIGAVLLTACHDQSHATNTPPSAAASQQVQVTLGEFFIHSARTSFLAKTPYRFVIHNTGTQNHDFLIMAPGDTGLQVMDDVYQQAVAFVYTIAPKTSQTLAVTFQHTAPKGTLEMSDHYSGQ